MGDPGLGQWRISSKGWFSPPSPWVPTHTLPCRGASAQSTGASSCFRWGIAAGFWGGGRNGAEGPSCTIWGPHSFS